MREVGDRLRAAVLADRDLALGEVLDDGAPFVADGGDEVDDLDLGGERGLPGPRVLPRQREAPPEGRLSVAPFLTRRGKGVAVTLAL